MEEHHEANTTNLRHSRKQLEVSLFLLLELQRACCGPPTASCDHLYRRAVVCISRDPESGSHRQEAQEAVCESTKYTGRSFLWINLRKPCAACM